MIAYHKLLLSRWADISSLKSSGFIVPDLATYSPLDMSISNIILIFTLTNGTVESSAIAMRKDYSKAFRHKK